MLTIRGSGPSENAYAKPHGRSSAPQAVKGAAARLPSLGPDGPPLTAWLRFALGQRRVARTRNPWLSRGFLPFGPLRTTLHDPEATQRRAPPGPGALEHSHGRFTPPTDMSVDPEKETVLAVFRDYFNLCSEELWLASSGKIDKGTWKLWRQGIREVAGFPSFASAWTVLRDEYIVYSDFRDFMDAMSEEVSVSQPRTAKHGPRSDRA